MLSKTHQKSYILKMSGPNSFSSKIDIRKSLSVNIVDISMYQAFHKFKRARYGSIFPVFAPLLLVQIIVCDYMSQTGPTKKYETKMTRSFKILRRIP